MPCSTCGKSNLKQQVNKVKPNAQPLLSSFKDSDFVLAYLIKELSPTVGQITKIAYGIRTVNEQFYVHKNDLDNVYFSLTLPEQILSEFSPQPEAILEEIEVVKKGKKKKDEN